MLHSAETARIRTAVPVMPLPQHQCQHDTLRTDFSVSSYAIGPIDSSHLISIQASCSDGEQCPLLVPKHVPHWILTHPEFRDGYERNYFSEEECDEEDDQEWGTVPHLLNLLYAKLRGEGFEDLVTGELDPNFGPWEIGWLLRDFTRLAETDRVFALTGLAHLGFLMAFLPTEQPASWPPIELMRARGAHTEALKAYRVRVRFFREQGTSYEEAQRFALG